MSSTSASTGYVTGRLPTAPARVLEVGCGDGELTQRLLAGGWQVTGIDPRAPTQAPFVRVSLEEFQTEGRFAAVVAVASLHHLEDLPTAVERLAALVLPGGRLIVCEFDRDRLDERAAAFDFCMRRELSPLGAAKATAAPTIAEHYAELRADLAPIHSWSR